MRRSYSNLFLPTHSCTLSGRGYGLRWNTLVRVRRRTLRGTSTCESPVEEGIRMRESKQRMAVKELMGKHVGKLLNSITINMNNGLTQPHSPLPSPISTKIFKNQTS